MIPDHIGPYQIHSETGRGGMATVYLAHDPASGKKIALKVLPREFLHDPKFYARFQREARTIASLMHPAIVPVLDFGEQEGQPYLVMPYMEGGSLSDRIRKAPLDLPEIAVILEPISRALDYIHRKGVVHRDLKPGNILFDREGNAYLSDFGIVRLAESTATLTGSGMIGTPAYMSPEQAHGDKALDGRSDIYSLGVILFQMLTGEVPYKADTPIQMAMKHILDPIPNVLDLRSDLPEACQKVVDKALAKEQANRYPTGAAFVKGLAEVPGAKRIPEPEPPREEQAPSEKPLRREPSIVKGEPERRGEDLLIQPTEDLHVPSEIKESSISSVLKTTLVGGFHPYRGVFGGLLLIGLIAGYFLLIQPNLLATSPDQGETQTAEGSTRTSLVTDTDGPGSTPANWTPKPSEIPAEIPSQEPSSTFDLSISSTIEPLMTVSPTPSINLPTPTTSKEITSENIAQLQLLYQTSGTYTVAWSQDGRRLAATGGLHPWYGNIHVMDVDGGTLIDDVEGHDLPILAITWSPIGYGIASGSRDNTIRVWDNYGSQESRVLEGHSGDVMTVSWSPDAKYLASGSRDTTVRIWSVKEGNEMMRLIGHTDDVMSLSWSPDGRYLASGSMDFTVRIWDVESGETIHTMSTAGHIWSVAWSPDGTLIASGGSDGAVRLWNPQTGRQLQALIGHYDIWPEWKVLDLLARHVDGVTSVSWSPDVKLLASAGADATIRIWDISTGNQLRILEEHKHPILNVSWSPDGTHIASEGYGHPVLVWGIVED